MRQSGEMNEPERRKHQRGTEFVCEIHIDIDFRCSEEEGRQNQERIAKIHSIRRIFLNELESTIRNGLTFAGMDAFLSSHHPSNHGDVQSRERSINP